MIFDSETATHLKPWLVRTLEPICDAEPGALAEYILALLKHNVPENEMRKELTVQLEEFLEKECQPFIDTLFTVLRTKTYLPYTSTASGSSREKPMDIGIPIPLDSLIPPPIPTSPARTRKRSLEDEGDGRTAKGPRLSNEGDFSRYSRPDSRTPGAYNGDHATNGYRDTSPQMRGHTTNYMGNGRRPQAYQPPDMKRGICRDYHNNGYCSRGALCKFSHGEDAVIPGQMFPMNGNAMQGSAMPFAPLFNQYGVPTGPSSAYDPRESRMDIRASMNGRSQMRPAFLPRAEDGVQVLHTSGELPVIQDLTPDVPHSEVTPNPHHTLPPTASFLSHPGASGTSQFTDVVMGSNAPIPNYPRPSGDIDMAPPNGRANFAPHGPRGGRPLRGRGTFGDIPTIRPERRRDKTLVVEKIPAEKLSLENVNDWFKRFGTVTNVAIDKGQAKALVSFSEHEEAHAAWKSEDAVFSNRFVKVFWHRPMEGHGQVGAKMLAASAPLVANIGAKEVAPLAPRHPPATPRKSSTPNAGASAIAAKQKQLEEQIAEQKSLMASLSTATSEEKKTIMQRLKALTSTPTTSPPTPSTAPTPTRTAEAGQHQKELLDKELELLNMSSSPAGGEEKENPEDLKAKLEVLRAEAASLGIPDTEPGYPRSYRGRGRGGVRGYYRGAMRGGARPSMKLDNRPKQLLVKGVPSDKISTLKDWYETTGQVDSVTSLPSGDVVVAFKTRAAAEQGLSKGSNVVSIGTVQISWHTGPLPTAKQVDVAMPDAGSTSPATPIAEPKGTVPTPEPETEITRAADEEEAIASGWGEDGEDGMGMF